MRVFGSEIVETEVGYGERPGCVCESDAVGVVVGISIWYGG